MTAAEIFDLSGRTAVLTGATGFLGRTFASALLQNGCRVIAFGRGERLGGLVERWQAEFGSDRVEGRQVDMYRREELDRTLDELCTHEGAIDILINNAHDLSAATGFNVPEGRLENAEFEAWERNLLGGIYWPALTSRKLAPALRAKGRGSIINISTMYAIVAPSPALYEGTSFINPPGYSAAKAGLLALTRYTASFWGAAGIRANAILPGPFSNIEETGPNSVPPKSEFLDRLAARTCLGRTGRPRELVGALLFLASDASSYVTGQTLVVDGGWTVT